jgi:ubiquinol-cytochrome c reductase cytochrome b subunit
MDSPVKPKHRLRQWVEKRWPVASVMRWGTVDEIPGGTRFAYVLGSATLALFAVLVITGVWQLLYYVPTVDHAYDSVMFLRLQVPLGWLVHGLHYWAAQAFIVVMGLHMARVFIWAAYKKPRELTWVLGVVLLLLGAAFIFTGAILPWDSLGYWAGVVGTNMAGTVPLIGNFLKLLMRGGDAMGQMTLSRAFAVHVAILPALTFFFIVAHIVAFRQFGSVGPWKPKKPEKTGSFWPDQTFKELLVVAVILMGLICLSAFVRAPISGPADPLDNSYTPKPEWNFLFLYEALKAFKGSWEWMGTVVIPALLVLLLFAVPFIDRNEKRNPFRRPVAMLSGCMFVAVILVLTFICHYSNSGANAPASSATASAPINQVAAPAASAPSPAAPETAPPVSTNVPAPAATASAPTNQVAASANSAVSPATPETPPAISTSVPAPAAVAPAPTNQVAAPAASAATPTAPETTLPVSTNAPAPAATAPAPANQVAASANANPAASKQNVIPSQTNAVADNDSGSTNQSPTYLRDVQPIFAASCARCHNPQTRIYNWLDYKSAFADRWEIRRRVWDSWKGWYYKEAMPMPGSPESLAFTDAERLTIRKWVDGDGGAVRGVAPAPAPIAPEPTNQVAGSATSAASPAVPGSSQPNTTAATTDLQAGRGLFVSAGCVTCHKIEGKGGVAGPDLSHEAKLGRSSQWLITQITDPRKHVPTTIMPAHKNLTQSQLKGLADFILNPSSSQAGLGAGTESSAKIQPSASAAQPAQEQQNTTNTSPNSASPATDAPAASATVVKMIGDPKHGAILFDLDCAKCHGKDGEGKVPNPGSQAGVVSPLAPISRGLFSDDPVVFAANIDRFIQHGATPPGPAPALQMPAFGTTRSLTVQEIANIEAYVLSLNGVDAAKILHPGIEPAHFVAGTAVLLGLALLAIGGLWVHYRTSASAQPGERPTPEDFQTLQHEVTDLKQKLEEMETRNRKE